MKVAIIVSGISQLGPVKVIQALVNSLSTIDSVRVRVFYFDKKIDTRVKISVPVERIGFRNFNFHDFDIIHTNGIRPDFFAFVNRKKIKYHISTIHNFVFDDLEFNYNKLVSWIFGNLWLIFWNRADVLVCISKVMKNHYSRWFSNSKIKVVYNGIADTDESITPDNDAIERIYGLRERGFTVLGSVGVLNKRKAIDQILYAIAANEKLALVILGNGKQLAFLQRLTVKLAIKDRCLFLGFRSNAVNYYKYFDYFIMPSRSEGFGLALIEAIQQKIPVICSDIEVFKELFSEKEITFFKLDDTISLKKALETALKIGKQKVELAYSRYINNYTDNYMVHKYYELYKSAL